jgi:hypothetical protein
MSTDTVGEDWQQVPIKKLDIPEAAAYADLVSITDDLEFVIRACERLHVKMVAAEAVDPVVARALWMSALVAYARCFKTGKRRRLTLEDVKALPLQGDVVEWHWFLMNMRNKHIAHSVNPFEIVSVGAVVGTAGGVEAIGHLSMHHIGLEEGGVDQTGLLAVELRKLVVDRIEHQRSQVLEAAQAFAADDLAKLPDLGATTPGNQQAGTART